MLRRFFGPGGNATAAGSSDVVASSVLSKEGTAPHSPDVDEKDEKHTSPAPSDTEAAAAPTAEAQAGVQGVEAVTLSWNKSTLIIIYINMWCLYAVNAFQGSITGNLAPFILSGFESHSLVPTIYIVQSAMSAAVYLPLAKTLDLWGRPQGFLLMVTVATVGTILLAATNSVQTYCAGQVLYGIGFGGLIYTVDVITSDTSKLKNRGLAFAFTSSPYMITALAGPKIAERFYETNWRWAYGAWAILLPVVASPLFFILLSYQKKAEKAGLLVKEPSGRTTLQSIKHYLVEFDALAVFLLAGGLVMFLLPFNLADSAPNGWKTDYIIALLVVGFVFLISFGFWECIFAPKSLLPYNLLINRTVIGTILLDMAYQISYYSFASYFSSFLQVVKDLSLSEAGYITGTFDIVSGVLLFFVGYLIRRTSHFKWLLLVAVPLYLLSLGLLIKFRTPQYSIGLIVMCQIFQAMAGSTMILCMQVSIMAASDHQHIAAVLALLNTAGLIGGSIGSAVSGAIWTNTFPTALARFLPEDALESLADIYGDLALQLSYPVGDPVRIGIQEAYAYAQRFMLIGGIAFMALSLVWILLIKNINVAEKPQMKGVLF